MPLFSRKKEKEETKRNTSENVNWHENEQVNPMYEGNTGAREQKSTGANISIARLYDELYASQKGGLSKKNSDYYNEVSGNLVHVLSLLSHSLPDDMEQVYAEFKVTQEAYQKLILSCQRYLQRHSFSSKGKARHEIVEKIMNQAEDDIESLNAYIGQHLLLPESERATHIGGALGFARRKRMKMKKKDSDYAHVGGAMSRLTVFKRGDLENSDESGFFKEQDIFTYHEDSNEKLAVFEIMESAKKITQVSDELYDKACNTDFPNVADGGGYQNPDLIEKYFSELGKISSDEKFVQFVELVYQKYNAWTLTKSKLKGSDELNMNLKEGQKVNLSNRNVATSRVAEALGLGDLIAKSETVEMVEAGQKKGRKGNFMQKAKGVEAGTLGMAHMQRADRLSEDKKQRIKDSDLIKEKITGNFQKQMASLQVLDYLTGQIDRNAGNYMIQEDGDGNMTGIMGIDNDLSFGNAQLEDFGNGDFGMGGEGRSPVDKEGNFILPHMDIALANRILALTKEQLKFLLVDLIEPENIQYACERLEILKKAIAKAMENTKVSNKKVFLKSQDDWKPDKNPDILQDSLARKTYMRKFVIGK